MFVYVCARFFIFSQLIKMIIDERANVGKIQQSIQTLQLGLYLEKEASVHAGWEGSQPDVLTSGYPNYCTYISLHYAASRPDLQGFHFNFPLLCSCFSTRYSANYFGSIFIHFLFSFVSDLPLHCNEVEL